MTDILKGKIIVKAIKAYKNREEWTDIYVQENYADAIDYMLENFDKYFGVSGNEVGSMVPQGARIKKLDQGDRSVEYEYNSTSTTTNNLNAIIKSDLELSALLGHPLMRCM